MDYPIWDVTVGGGMSRWLTDTNSRRVSFTGGLVATRERRHLSLSTVELFPEGIRRFGRLLAAAVAAATVGILTYASVLLVLANREEEQRDILADMLDTTSVSLLLRSIDDMEVMSATTESSSLR